MMSFRKRARQLKRESRGARAEGRAGQRRQLRALQLPGTAARQLFAIERPTGLSPPERQWLAKRLGQWQLTDHAVSAASRGGKAWRHDAGRKYVLVAVGISEQEIPDFLARARRKWRDWRAKRAKPERDSHSSDAES